MAKFGRSDDLVGAEFVEANLRGARFVECDLSGAVMRGVDLQGADLDAPWLSEPGGSLKVNGVEVAAYVDGELNRRFPGRAERRAKDPDGLRAAWATVEQAWADALKRVESMPEPTVDASVDGEWSFAQTLRHLVHASDLWIGRSVLGREDFHPLGLSYLAKDDTTPPFADVLAARESRVAMVRDLIAKVTPEELDTSRANPHEPTRAETTRSCLHVILEEEWEHYRFATRDLDTLAAGQVTTGS
ncbi:DinB family protein [Kribbella sp. NPDC048915]|uniref:DinB family protein n=1 Tax=Kribbella sp. NPDC048915 TaxID=3155148 RepID=UPI0033CAA1D8